MASQGGGHRGRPRGASQAPPVFDQQAFVEAVGIAVGAIAQACAIVSQGRSNDLQRLEAHHPPMVIEGGVDVSHPDSRSDLIRGSELSPGHETLDWDSLPLFLFFFLKAELVPVGTQTIFVITKIIYIYKRTTTRVVSIKIYTHILSPIYIYKNCTFTFTNKSARHTCSEPQKYAEVFGRLLLYLHGLKTHAKLYA